MVAIDAVEFREAIPWNVRPMVKAIPRAPKISPDASVFSKALSAAVVAMELPVPAQKTWLSDSGCKKLTMSTGQSN